MYHFLFLFAADCLFVFQQLAVQGSHSEVSTALPFRRGASFGGRCHLRGCLPTVQEGFQQPPKGKNTLSFPWWVLSSLRAYLSALFNVLLATRSRLPIRWWLLSSPGLPDITFQCFTSCKEQADSRWWILPSPSLPVNGFQCFAATRRRLIIRWGALSSPSLPDSGFQLFIRYKDQIDCTVMDFTICERFSTFYEVNGAGWLYGDLSSPGLRVNKFHPFCS